MGQLDLFSISSEMKHSRQITLFLTRACYRILFLVIYSMNTHVITKYTAS